VLGDISSVVLVRVLQLSNICIYAKFLTYILVEDMSNSQVENVTNPSVMIEVSQLSKLVEQTTFLGQWGFLCENSVMKKSQVYNWCL